jgi:hypothetical protein
MPEKIRPDNTEKKAAQKGEAWSKQRDGNKFYGVNPTNQAETRTIWKLNDSLLAFSFF